MRTTLLVALLLLLAATSAQTQAPPRSFDADHGMMLNYIHRDRTADFERVMQRVRELLTQSSDPLHQETAAGWRLFKAHEDGPNNSVLYVWFVDPAPRGANYAISQIVSELASSEAESLYETYSGSFAGGQSVINLDEIELGEPSAAAATTSTASTNVSYQAAVSARRIEQAAANFESDREDITNRLDSLQRTVEAERWNQAVTRGEGTQRLLAAGR